MHHSASDKLKNKIPKEIEFNQIYEKHSLIGKGAFAQVYLMTNKLTKEKCAVKIIAKHSLKEEKIDNLRKEARILSQLHHPNIVKFKEVQKHVFETEAKIYIVMEYIAHGTLQQLMDDFEKCITKTLLQAVEYIHSMEIIHRDIKPENILLSSKDDFSSLKVADYGLSACFFNNDQITSILYKQCGTAVYMAPEIFANKIYSKPVDIFGVGVIMYQLIAQRHPYFEKNIYMKTFIAKLSQPVKFPSIFSKLAIDLFSKLCAVDPQQRYIPAQALQHP